MIPLHEDRDTDREDLERVTAERDVARMTLAASVREVEELRFELRVMNRLLGLPEDAGGLERARALSAQTQVPAQIPVQVPMPRRRHPLVAGLWEIAPYAAAGFLGYAMALGWV